MSCYPSYPYVPAFVASGVSCTAPQYALHRSRLAVPGDLLTADDLFFRSKNQNFEANQIELELVGAPFNEFRVYFNAALVKTYFVFFGTGAIAALRNQINVIDPNPYMEMPAIGVDIYDLRAIENDGDGVLVPGLQPFIRQFMVGGQGAPSDASSLAAIRTGPTRTIYIVTSLEDTAGADVTPNASQRIQQWNGTMYISYCNNIVGACPGEGTC
jgi:hypothetical protein